MRSGHPRFYELTEEEIALHDAKNADYAQGGDPLGNFKRVASILSNYPALDLSDPTVVCMVYAFKQLDAALWMLSEGYEGQVENVDTRLRDVHIYIKIARILHSEREEVERIYISHPYGRRKGLAEGACEVNVLEAIEMAHQVILLGHHPEVPNLYHYIHKGWQDSPDESVWLDICLSGLRGCDAILMCGDWQDSEGCKEELARAKQMGLKIYYSLKEIPKGVAYGSD